MRKTKNATSFTLFSTRACIQYLMLCFILCTASISQAQSLFNWQHYRAHTDYFLDNGNEILKVGPEEVIGINKSTLNVSRYPYPLEYREFNYHNLRYWDPGFQEWNFCGIQFAAADNNNFRLRAGINCNANQYKFDGLSFSPIPNTYLGYALDSLYFLRYTGGDVFFVHQDKIALYQYDGNTVQIYDSLNSPLNYEVWNQFALAGNDIILCKDYTVCCFHNNVWTTYDTAFFNTLNINVSPIEVGEQNKFRFCNYYNSEIWTYDGGNGTWQNLPIPAAMNHSNTLTYVTNTCMDDLGRLWIAGDSLFCMYDGVQFTDHYNDMLGNIGSLSWMRIIGKLNNNILLMNDNNRKEYLYYTTTGALTPLIDTMEVLAGNTLLPSLLDGAGNLWFGAPGDGLSKRDANGNWQIVDLSPIGIYDGVLSLIRDTGNAIIFGYGFLSSDGPVRASGGNYTFINSPVNTFHHRVQSIVAEGINHYWFGGGGAGVPEGLAEYNNGTITKYQNPVSDNKVYAVQIDAQNNKWVSYESHEGVWKFDGINWTVFNTSNSPLPNDTVATILREPNSNAIWFCSENGFARYDNGSWTITDTSNSPLPSSIGEYMYWGADSSVWFCTRGGFSRFKNNTWETYSPSNSPLDNNDIESLVVDNECRVWAATEFGLSSAQMDCANLHGRNFTGIVYKSNNQPAPNVMVYVYRLNALADDIIQINSVLADASGKYNYFATDTGTYFFQAVVTDALNPGDITAYHDSAKIVQWATGIGIPNTNFTQEVRDIHLCKKGITNGNCTFKGKLVNYNNNLLRIGAIRVLLMKNGQAYQSILTNFDGSFKFTGLDTSAFEIWVDKLNFDNDNAPMIYASCSNPDDVYYFELNDHSLTAIPLGLNETAASENIITIFPNPVQQELNISFNDVQFRQYEIRLMDLNGKLLAGKKVSGSRFTTRIPTDGLRQGVYILAVNGQVFKVVK